MQRQLTDYCVREGATMHDAVAVIQRNGSRCCIVVGDTGKVVGVFSEGDVMRALLRGTGLHVPLRSLIQPSFVYLRERDLDAAREHVRDGISLVPVLDEEFRLVDVIRISDVV
jgi:CBS domain-containing protein